MLLAAWLLQADPWYVVLRDITVILAAASLVLSSIFLSIVGWQLWRLGKELRDEAHPIVGAVQELTTTVGDTATFLKDRVAAIPLLGGGKSAAPGPTKGAPKGPSARGAATPGAGTPGGSGIHGSDTHGRA